MNIERQFFFEFKIRTNISLGYLGFTDANIISLICILNKHLASGLGTCCLISGETRQQILEDVLHQCLRAKDDIYNEVKEVFALEYRPEEVAFDIDRN